MSRFSSSSQRRVTSGRRLTSGAPRGGASWGGPSLPRTGSRKTAFGASSQLITGFVTLHAGIQQGVTAWKEGQVS